MLGHLGAGVHENFQRLKSLGAWHQFHTSFRKGQSRINSKQIILLVVIYGWLLPFYVSQLRGNSCEVFQACELIMMETFRVFPKSAKIQNKGCPNWRWFVGKERVGGAKFLLSLDKILGLRTKKSRTKGPIDGDLWGKWWRWVRTFLVAHQSDCRHFLTTQSLVKIPISWCNLFTTIVKIVFFHCLIEGLKSFMRTHSVFLFCIFCL